LYNYFDTLKKHGLKLTLAIFLGNLVTTLIFVGTLFVLIIIAGLSVAIGGFESYFTQQLDQLENIPFEELPHVLVTILSSPSFLVFLLLSVFMIFFLAFILSGFQTAGSVTVTREALIENRTDIGSFFTNGFKFTGKMAGLLFLSSLPYLVPIGLAFSSIPLSAAPGATAFLSGLPLLLIGFVLALLIAIALLHAPIILIAEKTSVTRAISLSFSLFRKAFARVFGSAFYSFLIYLVTFPVFLLLGFFSDDTMLGLFIIQLLIGSAITMLVLLLITYRYYKYLRTYIHPNGTEEPTTNPENTEPSSALAEDDAPPPANPSPS
jgi:hypothetical protein